MNHARVERERELKNSVKKVLELQVPGEVGTREPQHKEKTSEGWRGQRLQHLARHGARATTQL